MSVRILIGDMRQRLRDLPEASVDSVVCDPPYHLLSTVKRFGKVPRTESTMPKSEPHARMSRGFMGQTWDGGDVAFQAETWAEVLRVLKPGGHLVAFSGTRTYHRMAVAIEDAGFEVRDMLSWLYGAGFPKSYNIDKKLGHDERCRCQSSPERDLRLVRESDVSSSLNTSDQRGQVLFEGVPEQSSSGSMLRAEPEEGPATRAQLFLEGRNNAQAPEGELQRGPICEGTGMGAADGSEGPLHNGAPAGDGADVRLPADTDGSGEPQGSQPGEQSSEQPGAMADERRSQAWGAWPLCDGCGKPNIPEGYGSALKPACEPICLARKPLDGTILNNFLKWGTGAINVDGCRIATDDCLNGGGYDPNGTSRKDLADASSYALKPLNKAFVQPQGRWPANIIHDGSDEVLAGFPDSEGSRIEKPCDRDFKAFAGGGLGGARGPRGFADEGSAARFFYCAKATTEERGEGNTHPTVKPVALMRWLCRLVTPKGGTVLDPFMGSGSTGLAADAEQFNFIGCELSSDYAEIARQRLLKDCGLFADISVEHTAPSTRAA